MASALQIVGLTPQLLDTLFDLRYPWAKARTVDLELVVQWQGPLPNEIEKALFELTWTTVCKLTTLKSTARPELVEACLAVIGRPADSTFLPRAVALVMLLDQCPRMFHSQSTNARWVSDFFDPLAQNIVSHLLDYEEILRHELWSAVGYDFEAYMVITSLLLSAADHSESLERHEILRQIQKHRRAALGEASGHSDPFAERLDENDPLAFPRFMRSEKPHIRNVYDFLYLRMAIIDIHYPIIAKFGRYPWRNGNIGRLSTQQELQFLEDSDHFGDLDQDVKAQIDADIAAERCTPFS